MNNQIKEEGLTDAYLLGKYDGIKKGRADVWADIDKIINNMTNPIDTMKIIIKELKEQNND